MTLAPQLTRPEAQEFVKVITTGRITGIPHVVIVRSAFFDGSFHVLAGRSGSDWSGNALAAGNARIRIGDQVYQTVVTTADQEGRARTVEAFVAKYGARVVKDWYSDSCLCLTLTPLGPPSMRGASRGELEASTDFAGWKSRHLDYYDGVVEAFDAAAEEYDFTINQNFINRWVREKSIRELLRLVAREDTIVEVGCGTGAEAVRISSRVRRIVATDISERMIAILRMKVGSRKLEGRIIPLKVRASEISRVSAAVGGEGARVAYSFNGALNCEPDIDRFPSELSKILLPGGLFVCSIRNKLCLSEAVLHALALQFDRMAPRKRQPIMVSVGGIDIPSYYYRPREFARILAPQFRLRRLIGLPSILPPAYLSDRYVRVRKRVAAAERLEEVLSTRFPFNRMGDQSLFVFQKRD